MRLRNVARRGRRNPLPTQAVLLQKDDGVKARYFKLREDVTGNGPFWAQNSNKEGDSLGGYLQVHNWQSIMTGAQAGYVCQCLLINGTWDVTLGPCAPGCATAGTITIANPPVGTVGNAYTHTVSNSGLSTFTASELPEGLSMDASGEITGTPQESGTFYVELTGTSPTIPSGGTCTLTRILVLVIEGA